MRHHRSWLMPVLAVALACHRSAPKVSPLPPSRGSLEVTVRPADRPTQPLPNARVVLRGLRDTLAGEADDHGIVSFPDLPVGDYDILVRRIGYHATNAAIRIQIDCRTKAEAFLAPAILGIAPPPPLAGRVAVARC